MARTVIGLFETRSEAESVRADLLNAGFEEREISLSAQTEQEATEDRSFWDQVKEWLGVDETSYYQEGARRGATMVVVDTSDERADAAVEVIQRYEPMDLDVQAKQWQAEGWRPPEPQQEQRSETRQEETAEGESRVPLPEEELHVGKRRVQRGGARIYTRVTEQPAEEQVELTDEHVDVERRPADRPADEDAFRERTIEASETHEEPVVEKEAHVNEEMVIKKEAETHSETVRGTVRKTEAEVDRGDRGQDDVSRLAYQFGQELAHDDRYRDRSWESIEPEVQQDFERRKLGDWSRYRDTVHEAYDRSRAA